MALPTTFSGVKTDKDGRRYVVHEPSGVIYFVRDDHPVWGRNAKHGPCTTFSRSAKKKAKKAEKEAKKNAGLFERPAYERDRFTSPPAPVRVIQPVDPVEYFATFVPVMGVTL